MKRLALLSLFTFATLLAFSQEEVTFVAKPAGDFAAPAFEWEGLEHDFGKIKHNVPVTHEFKFKNTGSAPIIISKVKGSCGCTVTEYSKEPIPPGQWGKVKATFNAAAVGQFTKTVTVTANTEGGPIILRIRGEVAREV